MSRIASALNTDDLAHYERPCDADTVRALGLTSIHRSLGVLIIEAKEACAGESPHDAARIRDLIAAVANAAKKQARRDKLIIKSRAVAELMVKELILDRCHRCQGRGIVPLIYGPQSPDTIEKTPGAECPTCLGSGRARRDFAGRADAAGYADYTAPLKRFYEALESRLAEAEMYAFDHYIKRFWR